MTRLYKSDPGFEPPFDESIWANQTKNPTNAQAAMHNDHCNLAFDWCAIQAFGDFDPHEGSHLILQQFGVVTEFPPGSTILIPSSIVTHGNVPVHEHEQRSSLVHFSAGGLFRWVEYGFQTWESLKKSDPLRAACLWHERKTTRLPFALSLFFSKVDNLVDDHRAVFGDN